MAYESLNPSYWEKQKTRIEKSTRDISERMQSAPGRVVPDTDDLVIGTGRRLDLAIMFLDICGFSSRTAEATKEQESLLAALNLFFTEMIRISEDYGGTVEKNTGDGLMTYFEDGPKSSPESGVKRAIACALTMMAANRHILSPIYRASSIEPIRFRITVDYGPVTIGRLGAPRRFNAIVAVGTTANVASKMLDCAGPDEILLGDAAKRELPAMWQLRWTLPHVVNSGWVYRMSGESYVFHRYIGRWSGYGED